MFETTLRNRPCRTRGSDPSWHEFRKSSASTPASVPKMGAISSGVMVKSVDVMECEDSFRVHRELAQDAIGYLKPVWMQSAAKRGPSKITFIICCRKICRAPVAKVAYGPSGGASASRADTAQKISEYSQSASAADFAAACSSTDFAQMSALKTVNRRGFTAW
jgi:hypothetical protein